MASFNLKLRGSVEKDLRRLDRSQIPRILSAIEKLAQDPFPAAAKKLVGSNHTYRLRIGDYRVVYVVNRESGEIEVERVRHRKEVYR